MTILKLWQNSLKFALISSVVACTTTESKKIDSEWSELNRVGAISCSTWPVRESEIDIASMSATGAGSGGFAATMRLRNGSTLPVFADTGGSDKVDVDQLTAFPIGRDAKVVAVSEWNKEPVAFVVQNKNERAWLEIRGIRDNRMISRMATPLQDEVSGGNLVPASSGWWLQLSHSESESSFVYVNPEKKGTWSFVQSNYLAHSRFASLASSGVTQNAYVVELPKGSNGDSGVFSITMVEPSGKFTARGQITLQTKGGLESWSASAVGDKIVIALVRGDSMIGQATLVVAATSIVGNSSDVVWKQEFSFADVHVGEPVWLSNGSKALLGLIKWIDAEGSLSRVRVDAKGAEALTDVGVFPKGTLMITGYLSRRDNGLGAFRYRDNELWKYKLCRLSL